VNGTRPAARLALAVLLCIAWAAVGGSAKAEVSATTLPPAANPVAWGVYEPNAPGDMSAITGPSGVEAEVGKQAGIIQWYEHWQKNSAWWNCDPTFFHKIILHGSIPMLNWISDDAFDTTSPDPAFNNPTLISQLGDTTSQTYNYVKNYADCIATLGTPVMLRFDYEMNGNWMSYSPGVNGNNSDGSDYVALWHDVHGIFEGEHASNVLWVWAPNVEYPGSTNLCWGGQNVYPGDSEVDWIGVDGYNWGTDGSGHTWTTFTGVFQQTLADEAICSNSTPRKPQMISEVASVDPDVETGSTCHVSSASKAGWVTTAFGATVGSGELPATFPNVSAFLWFDETEDSCHHWRIDSTPAVESAFAATVGANPQYVGGPAALDVIEARTPCIKTITC
jgi:mannan endo-1,4-beta-mannosidase